MSRYRIISAFAALFAATMITGTAKAANTYSDGVVSVDTSDNAAVAITEWPAGDDAKVKVNLTSAFAIESETYEYAVATVATSVKTVTADDFELGENCTATGNSAVDGIKITVTTADDGTQTIKIVRKAYSYYNISGSSSTYWDTDSYWTPSGAFDPEKDYLVWGQRQMRVNTSNTTFGGRSLTIGNSLTTESYTDFTKALTSISTSYNLATKAATSTIADLTMADGAFMIFANLSSGSSNSQYLEGNLKVVAAEGHPAVIANGNGRTGYVNAPISGAGHLMIRAFENTTATVHLNADNSGFTGKLTVAKYSSSSSNQQNVYLNQKTNLGANPETLDEDAIELYGARLINNKANLDFSSVSNRGIKVLADSNIDVYSGYTMTFASPIAFTSESVELSSSSAKGTLALNGVRFGAGKFNMKAGYLALSNNVDLTALKTLTFAAAATNVIDVAATNANGFVLGGALVASDGFNVKLVNVSALGPYVLYTVKSTELTAENISVTSDNAAFVQDAVTVTPVTLDGETYSQIAVRMKVADGVFVWNGEGDGTTWSDGNNWEGDAAPSANADLVYIPAGSGALTLQGGTSSAALANLGTLTIARDIVLNGYITVNTIRGSGLVTIGNADVYSGTSYIYYTDLCVATRYYNANTGAPTLYGNLSGAGAITFLSGNSSSAGFKFYGDASGFTGSYTGCTRNNGNRDGTKFYEEYLDGSKAQWKFGSNNGGYPFQTAGATLRFGALYNQGSNGGLSIPVSGVTIEVGALDDKANVYTGTLSDDSNTLRKVGESSTLTLTLSETKGTLEVAAGTVTLNTTAPSVIRMTGTSAVLVTSLEVEPIPTAFDGYEFTTNTVSGVSTYSYLKSGTVYTWVGASGAEWATASNWELNGSAPESAPEMGVDRVVVPAGSSIVIAGDYDDTNMTLGENVTFATAKAGAAIAAALSQDVTLSASGDGYWSLTGQTYAGEVTVTLKNATLDYSATDADTKINWTKLVLDGGNIVHNSNAKYIYIYSDVEVKTGSTGTLVNNYKQRFVLNGGKLTGGGTLTLTEVGSGTIYFDNADLSGFTGTLNGALQTNANGSIVFATALDLSGASVNMYADGKTPSATGGILAWGWRMTDATIKYGALNMNLSPASLSGSGNDVATGNTIEIGYLNKDSALYGTWPDGAGNADNTIKWVGTGDCEFICGVTNAPALVSANGGTIRIANRDTIPETIQFETAGTVYVPNVYTSNRVEQVIADSNSAAHPAVVVDYGSAYVWTGAAGDGYWSTAGNWKIGSETATTAPGEGDEAVIPPGDGELVITSSSTTTRSVAMNLLLERDVTLAGYFRIGYVWGDGTLTLNGLDFNESENKTATIDCDVVVKGTNHFNGYGQVWINGKFTGDGDFICCESTSAGGNYSGAIFNGDASEFTGYFQGGARANFERDGSAYYSTKSTSENARYKIGHTYSSGKNVTPFKTDDTTYKFGELTAPGFTLTGRSGVTIEVGNLNTTNYIGSNATANFNNNKLVKKGTGLLKLKATSIGEFELNSGWVWFDSDATIAADGSGIAKMSITGDSGLYLNPALTADQIALSPATTNNISLKLDANYKVTTAAPLSGFTGNMTKEGLGTIEFTETLADGAIGTITVTEGLLILPAGTDRTCGTGTYKQTLSDNRVLYYPAGYYVWNGGASGKWETAGNWVLNGATCSDGIYPTAGTFVVFASDAAVECTAPKCDSMIVEAAVTFTGTSAFTHLKAGTGSLIYFTGTIYGTGTITLGNNAGFGRTSAGTSYVYPNLVISAAEATPAVLAGAFTDKITAGVYVYSPTVTGAGYLKTDGRRFNVPFYGDLTEFTGTIEIVNGGVSRNNTCFKTGVPSGRVKAYNASKDGSFQLTDDYTADYEFGELSGSPQFNIGSAKYSCARTITIGALDTDATLGGNWYNSTVALDSNKGVLIKKTGTGTVTFSGLYLRAFELAGGVLVAAKDGVFTGTPKNSSYLTPVKFSGGILGLADGVTADISSAIADSTANIAVSNASDVVFQTALADSNTSAAFDKYGAGTLTLSVAPAWDKPTYTVMANGGYLAVPTGSAYTLGTKTYVSYTADGYDYLANSDSAVARIGDSSLYDTFERAINTLDADARTNNTSLATITVLDANAELPDGYIIQSGSVIWIKPATCRVVEVADDGTESYKYYNSMTLAFAAINTGDTTGTNIQVVARIDDDAATYATAKAITIDLYGHAWYSATTNLVNNGGEITITDSSVRGSGVIGATNYVAGVSTAAVKFTEGTFYGALETDSARSEIAPYQVSGGSWSVNPIDYVVEGYYVVNDAARSEIAPYQVVALGERVDIVKGEEVYVRDDEEDLKKFKIYTEYTEDDETMKIDVSAYYTMSRGAGGLVTAKLSADAPVVTDMDSYVDDEDGDRIVFALSNAKRGLKYAITTSSTPDGAKSEQSDSVVFCLEDGVLEVSTTKLPDSKSKVLYYHLRVKDE